METRGFGKLKTEYEVRVVYGKSCPTLPVGDPHDDMEAAETEARELHAEDGRHYKVTKITKQCVFRINTN